MFGPSANRAPRHATVLVSLLLMLLGAIGTWGKVAPGVGGWMFVAATVLMLLGVFLPGL
jgi:hypothetical protein